VEKPKREKKVAGAKRDSGEATKPRVKNDPKHVAAARELRDRYLERFNSGMMLPQGKYDASRALSHAVSPMPATVDVILSLPAPLAA
jgi:hypothetical protein